MIKLSENSNKAFMLMMHNPEDNSSDCVGGFFAKDIKDAKRQFKNLNLSNEFYISNYRDNGEEVYQDLETLYNDKLDNDNEYPDELPFEDYKRESFSDEEKQKIYNLMKKYNSNKGYVGNYGYKGYTDSTYDSWYKFLRSKNLIESLDSVNPKDWRYKVLSDIGFDMSNAKKLDDHTFCDVQDTSVIRRDPEYKYLKSTDDTVSIFTNDKYEVRVIAGGYVSVSEI